MQLQKAMLKGLVLIGAFALAMSANARVKITPPEGDGGRPGTHQPPTPSSEDAAGAVMCLTQVMMAGTKPMQCTKYVTEYFAIKDYKHGAFNPEATYNKRGKWLEQCSGCRASDREKVQRRFGRLPSI